jgi:hypothetical protein
VTRYRGRWASLVKDASEKQRALELLGKRLCAEFPAAVGTVVHIQIERITGKVNQSS